MRCIRVPRVLVPQVAIYGNINVSAKSIKRFKHRIREITGRSRGISMDCRLRELRKYIRGWMGYFGLANQLKLFAKLDGWIRRRVRLCYWKQWRRPKRRRQMKLIRLGVPRRSAERIMRSVTRYLTTRLKLVVNEEKSRVVACGAFEFLGFSFPKSRGNINVSAKSIKRFKHRIREITGRSRGISMDCRLRELRKYIRGWMGYFGLANQLKLFAKLDGWIRRRVRLCYWKQWRRPKRRRQMLIRLGVPRRQAIRHARSRKGYWRMSKTIATGVGLTNAWLEEQGLPRMKGLWDELAPVRRTA